MNGFLELDDGFKIPEWFKTQDLENIPIVKHVYGNKMEDSPNKLYWTEYQLEKPKYGAISFARKLYLEYPEISKYVIEYLQTLFDKIPFDITRLGLMKTSGSILPHFDESNRNCCINIGIKNSNIAITKTSRTNELSLFESQAEENVCQDGHAYLLDTSSFHEVISLDNTKERYLFTYGFQAKYDIILSCYKGKNKF